jgi:hypothetical protein
MIAARRALPASDIERGLMPFENLATALKSTFSPGVALINDENPLVRIWLGWPIGNLAIWQFEIVWRMLV